jgi:hypothetical protein
MVSVNYQNDVKARRSGESSVLGTKLRFFFLVFVTCCSLDVCQSA